MEEYNLRVFMLLTHNSVAAFPVCIIITRDETTITLIQALDMIKTYIPKSTFNNNGPSHGPMVVMTDNRCDLQEVFSRFWPCTTLLLCTFHMMQQVWRWLFERFHGINHDDKHKIMVLFKKVVYCTGKSGMEDLFEEMLNSEEVTKYNNLISYFNTLCVIKEAWALCYRSDLQICGNNTNNAIMVIKDDVFNRTKDVNLNALLDKLLGKLYGHYKEVKLLYIASGKWDGSYSSW